MEDREEKISVSFRKIAHYGDKPKEWSKPVIVWAKDFLEANLKVVKRRKLNLECTEFRNTCYSLFRPVKQEKS